MTLVVAGKLCGTVCTAGHRERGALHHPCASRYRWRHASGPEATLVVRAPERLSAQVTSADPLSPRTVHRIVCDNGSTLVARTPRRTCKHGRARGCDVLTSGRETGPRGALFVAITVAKLRRVVSPRVPMLVDGVRRSQTDARPSFWRDRCEPGDRRFPREAGSEGFARGC